MSGMILKVSQSKFIKPNQLKRNDSHEKNMIHANLPHQAIPCEQVVRWVGTAPRGGVGGLQTTAPVV